MGGGGEGPGDKARSETATYAQKHRLTCIALESAARS